MRQSDITDLCKRVAQKTGLRLSWVEHHVKARAGSSCKACGGLVGACHRCGGTGGKATPDRVSEALQWVTDNAEHIRSLGGKREDKKRQKSHATLVKAEEWKKLHPKLWDFVSDMFPSEFQRSMIDAIESGTLTDRQQAVIERLSKKPDPAPAKNTRVTVSVTMGSRGYVQNKQQETVYRFDFTTDAGWHGRVETKNIQTTRELELLQHGMIQGTVAWSKDFFAILSDVDFLIR